MCTLKVTFCERKKRRAPTYRRKMRVVLGVESYPRLKPLYLARAMNVIVVEQAYRNREV